MLNFARIRIQSVKNRSPFHLDSHRLNVVNRYVARTRRNARVTLMKMKKWTVTIISSNSSKRERLNKSIEIGKGIMKMMTRRSTFFKSKKKKRKARSSL